jgi:hypothetical protein
MKAWHREFKQKRSSPEGHTSSLEGTRVITAKEELSRRAHEFSRRDTRTRVITKAWGG